MQDAMLEYQRQSGFKMPGYHCWFVEGKLGSRPEGQILDQRILSHISNENPYSFGFTEASMELIAKKAGWGLV